MGTQELLPAPAALPRLSSPCPGTGQVITFQLAAVKPFGMSYKITPETTEKEVNARKCFQLPGSKEDVVTAQSVFPSVRGFKVGNVRARLRPGSQGTCRFGEGRAPLCPRVLGPARTCPHSPGSGEGSLPHPHWGRTPFPAAAAVLGRVPIPHKRCRLGTVWASPCTAAPSPPAPGLGTAPEQRGQHAVTELDTRRELGNAQEKPETFSERLEKCKYSGASPAVGAQRSIPRALPCTPSPWPSFYPVLVAMEPLDPAGRAMPRGCRSSGCPP